MKYKEAFKELQLYITEKMNRSRCTNIECKECSACDLYESACPGLQDLKDIQTRADRLLSEAV